MHVKQQVIIAVSAITLLNALSWAQSGKYDNSMRDSSSVSSRSDSTKNGTRLGTAAKSTSHRSARSDSLQNDSATHGYGVTPSDQGNKKSDVDITTRIRKEIMATKGMSINAQNVKIVTIDGVVTLRGKVDTQKERALVVDIAMKTVEATKVINELQVK